MDGVCACLARTPAGLAAAAQGCVRGALRIRCANVQVGWAAKAAPPAARTIRSQKRARRASHKVPTIGAVVLAVAGSERTDATVNDDNDLLLTLGTPLRQSATPTV